MAISNCEPIKNCLNFRIGCRAIGKLAGIEGTDVYCLRNCFHNDATDCPKDECECYSENDEEENEEKRRQQQLFVEAEASLETTTLNNDIWKRCEAKNKTKISNF